MKPWKTQKLGDVVASGGGSIQTGPFGSQLHASDYVSEGIPCIMPANLKDNRVDVNGIARISKQDANRLSRHIVRSGDIVYSRRGDVTQKALIRDAEDGFFCGTGCLLLRPGEEIDSAFLTYYLSTPTYQTWIASQAVGATMPNLNTGILNRVSFCAPERREQERIAAVLSALDAKIELNQRLNAELEGMAKLLYDYWFLQYDFPLSPAQAAALRKPHFTGQPYRSSGGPMVYNEQLKREIPAGWEVGSLGELCSVVRGVTYSKDDVRSSTDSNAVPILRATNVNNGVIDLNGLVYVAELMPSEDQYLGKFEILMVMSSGSKAHVGKNAMYCHDQQVAFGAFCSKIVPRPSNRFFMAVHLQSDPFKKHIENVSRGTSINNLTNGHVTEHQMPLPPAELLQQYENTVSSMFEAVATHHQQSHHLAQLRDWLLPMLMNGQVRVLG